jgi:hypothetical protein
MSAGSMQETALKFHHNVVVSSAKAYPALFTKIRGRSMLAEINIIFDTVRHF